jgi:hypothetical protein
MLKKTNPRAAGKPNKSVFTRSLAFEMPSADVTGRDRARGVTLNRNNVHSMRSTRPVRRGANHAPMGAARKAGRRRGSASVNKSAFVRSLPRTMSAAEVITRGKAKGISLSAAQIYTIRANARRKGLSKVAAPSGRGREGRAVARGLRTSNAREADFIEAALDLGLTRAEALIAALRARAAAALR